MTVMEFLRSFFEPFEWFRFIVSTIIGATLSTALSRIIWRKIIKKFLAVIAGIFIFLGITFVCLIIMYLLMPKVIYFENFEKGLGRFKNTEFVEITEDAISGKYSLNLQNINSSFGYYGTISSSEDLFRKNYNYLVSFKYKVIEGAYFTNPDDPTQKLSHFYLDIHIHPAQGKEYHSPKGGGIQWNGEPGSNGTARVSFKADAHDLCLHFGVIGKGTTLIDHVKVLEIGK